MIRSAGEVLKGLASRRWCGWVAWLAAGLLSSPAALAQGDLPRLVGSVFKVIDADTIDVQLDSGPIRVRLKAIDAPELGQPWGRESAQALASLVMGKQVQIEPYEQDRYDRLTATVFLDDLNVNAELVRRGFAWAYRRYMRAADMRLCLAEAGAREAERGLWGATVGRPIAPWEWRRRKQRREFTDYGNETAERCIAAMGGD